MTDTDDAWLEYRRTHKLPADRVEFVGGPRGGDAVDGMLARVLGLFDPPFFCVDADGRYEHYERVDLHTFAFVAACTSMAEHPDCGHDHTEA